MSESLEKFSARLKELFSKDLGADSGYPEKTGINMVTADRKTDKRRNTAIAVIAAIVALILIKFLVVDMIVSALSARSQYMNIQESLDQLKASNVNYEKTLDKYNRQGDGRLSPKERRLSDRSDDLDLITDKVGSDATIKNIQISGNKATVSVEGLPWTAFQLLFPTWKEMEEFPMFRFPLPAGTLEVWLQLLLLSLNLTGVNNALQRPYHQRKNTSGCAGISDCGSPLLLPVLQTM